MVSASEIESALDTVSATLLKTSGNVTFSQVLGSSAILSDAYLDDNAFYGQVAQSAPTAQIKASAVGEYIDQYMTEHSLRSLKKANDSQIAVQLYELYMRRFPSTLFALFQTSTELGKGYAGSGVGSSLIADQIIQPSFIQIAGNADYAISKPFAITSNFAQPATQFANTLSATVPKGTGAIGWIKPYFVLDTTLATNALYTGSPNLADVSSFVVLGVLDMKGQIDGVSYANADQTNSKPIYNPESSIDFDDGLTAHVIDNGLSLYVGKSTQGYVNVHFETGFGAQTTATAETLDVDIRLLGQMFAVSPTIVTSQY